MNDLTFQEFPKMARLSRRVIVTEKIDGTNAQICIGENGEFLVGSRNRYITPEDDNFGFAKWAYEHKDELITLGPGRHFGEWWGQGIQRRYDQTEKHFSLFNVGRWWKERPTCCDVVPILWQGAYDDMNVNDIMQTLATTGSIAASGFMKPEGIVIFHIALNASFKKTFEKDAEGKGQ